MIMDEPLFNQLRTKEQLCYKIICLLRDHFGILGYSIIVFTQADKYSTEHVDNRIEVFLKAFKKILKETTDEDLKSIKEALIKQKQCDDINLREEFHRNWAEITTGNYMFDRIENELMAIEHITIEELREWMNSHTMNGSNLRKLSVHVVGTPKSADKENEDVKLHAERTQCKDTNFVYYTNT